ncbi:MAG TPA: asparagine--tRNA ligase [Candidatus Nanoarchaeia archaeon]|nr:asparagine--tRNA ligase [Candidatus Nanoarchaeia archaeon]
MSFKSIQEAIQQGSGKVAIRGWVYRERGSNQLKFIVLRDSTNIIQCVLERTKFEDRWEEIDKIQVETSMEIEGTIKEDKRAPTVYEISAESFKIIGTADTFPITKDQSPEFLLDVRHLAIRSRRHSAIFKVKNTVLQAFRNYYLNQGYFEWTPPIFQPNQCEGGSTLFEVKYYKEKLFMTQSWQLYAEAGIFGLEKLFTISPCFRAEKSKTSRHLSEFWMAEMETAWMQLPQLIDSVEGCVSFIVKEVVEKNEEDLKLLGQDVDKLRKITAPFPRITYKDALKLLKEKEKVNVAFGKDLRTVEEDLIVKHFDKPVIVTNYPKVIMAFYKPTDPNDPETALCLDVLAPEGYGEIVGGSQRDTDIESLKKALVNMGEKPEHYEWYFDTRRYGGVPHSGYGLGVERVVAWLCHLDNIKDAIPFPRTMLRWKP